MFKVTSDQSPLATYEELPPAESDFFDCSVYSSCGGCSNNGHCGFCYETEAGAGSGPDNAFNGSCVARSEDDPDGHAAFGRCSNFTGTACIIFLYVSYGKQLADRVVSILQ
jgi:hypothetical protein